MKPEEQANDEESGAQVAGDIIGDTAYSQRFVLKILLKFANLDTLKDEVTEKAFEDDICVLWDMTAERDVVLFLQKHDVLNLISFAITSIENARIIEIIIGIIGNMCCHKEVVAVILKMESFLTTILEQVKSDDSLILIQVLRLVNSCLYLVNDETVCQWIDLFTKVNYSEALYFILKNSTNKDLLITALENLNTIFSYCNIEEYRTDFFDNFVTSEALESLTTAFTEVVINQKDLCERDELERILVVTLQVTLNLVGFDKSLELYSDQKENVMTLIKIQLDHYENKFVNMKEIDSDLSDVLDTTYTILKMLEMNEVCGLETFFSQSLNMFRTLCTILKSEANGSSSFEEEDEDELRKSAKTTESPLCAMLCTYLEKCSDDNLTKALDLLGEDYDKVITIINDKEVLDNITKRTIGYRTRLKETVD